MESSCIFLQIHLLTDDHIIVQMKKKKMGINLASRTLCITFADFQCNQFVEGRFDGSSLQIELHGVRLRLFDFSDANWQ